MQATIIYLYVLSVISIPFGVDYCDFIFLKGRLHWLKRFPFDQWGCKCCVKRHISAVSDQEYTYVLSLLVLGHSSILF